MSTHKTLAILAAITSLGAGGAWYAYLYSLETFSTLITDKKGLKEDVPDRAGNKAQELFSSKIESVEGLSYIFEGLEEKIKNDNSSVKTVLKKACLKGYKSSHKNIFFEDKVLLKNLNVFCRLYVKDLFEPAEEAINDNTKENNDLLNKVNELLKTHNDKKSGSIGVNVKQGISTGDQYKEGCQKGYDSFYLGDDDRNGKVTDKYCRTTLVSKQT